VLVTGFGVPKLATLGCRDRNLKVSMKASEKNGDGGGQEK
jgi:hypothetical protein